jgi:UDP-glucose 4-epimerase
VLPYAANPEVRLSTTNPEIHFGENVVATFSLLEAIRKNEVEERVFASSSSVYGEPENIPVGENSPIKPVSVYGASKVACENLAHAYSNLYGIKAVILRYANVVGPRLRHGVIYDFIVKLGKNPKQLEILGDGTQTRSYIYIDDAVEATLIANNMVGRRFEVYNIGSEDCITVKEVADIVVDALELKNVKYVYKPVQHGIGWKGDVKNIALSIDKVKGFGFKPKLSSTEAARKTALMLKGEIQLQQL